MRHLIVSNRLPFIVTVKGSKFDFKPSSGGLVSALNSLPKFLWVGWPGEEIEEKLQPSLQKLLKTQKNAWPVFLNDATIETFYNGFCNKIIWPLFHSFPSFCVFREDYFKDYIKVNKLYANAVYEVLKPGDQVWIHDYHLMLLPKLIRDKFPNAKIGFFLHIPFPSFEIFRLLPSKWRTEILNGLTGSDLIGFHTYDYTQYFLKCMVRIMGSEPTLGKLLVGDRLIRADTFPLGIDFAKFYNAASSKEVLKEKKNFKKTLNKNKVILAIDRLDYTKGVIKRLEGFELFLEKNKKWHKRIVLILVSVPSRIGVEQYQEMKKNMDEAISRINGKFATLDWTPISYQYKSLSFNQLVALYNLADIALITPLRDGMNLIAKEYIASKPNTKGVLILSEMAGAAKELSEALIINPNTAEEIAFAIETALNIPKSKQIKKIKLMQERLSRYDVKKWFDDFLHKLDQIKKDQHKIRKNYSLASIQKKLLHDYKVAKKRLLIFDYLGTLQSLIRKNLTVKPPLELVKLLKNLSSDKKNNILILSNQTKKEITDAFGKLDIGLVAENGIFFKDRFVDWKLTKPLNKSWKDQALELLYSYVDRLPGSFIEEKEYSLSWNYSWADPELASLRAKELVDDLVNFVTNADLDITHGLKEIELRSSGIDKGTIALNWLSKEEYDFVLGMGDDATDEDLFAVLPKEAYSIKVGRGASMAKYRVASVEKALSLLHHLSSVKS